MKTLLTIALSTLVLSSAMAGTSDVVPNKFVNGSTYVRVTKVGSDKLSFEKCIKGQEKKTCKQLGPKKSYSISALIKQRKAENLEAAGTMVADVAIIAGLAFTGGSLAGGLFAGANSLGSGIFFADLAGKALYTGAVAGGAMTGGAIGAASTMFDPLNPIVQVNQARCLNSDILKDETVTRMNINEYIRNLETVLKKV